MLWIMMWYLSVVQLSKKIVRIPYGFETTPFLGIFD